MAAVCAIHQPNFFPWLGYFDKIRRADVFVFLDEVAYPRAGSKGMGSWTNRVKVDIQGRAAWFGCPVERLPSQARINEAVTSSREPWRARLVKTLEMNYKRAPGCGPAMSLLRPLIENPVPGLAAYNVAAIKAIAGALGFRCEFALQSQLATKATSTALLIEIVRAVGCDSYLCGGGAGGYQDDRLFRTENVRLIYQDYASPPYGDAAKFIPGLSVIDFLMKAVDWRAFPGTDRASG